MFIDLFLCIIVVVVSLFVVCIFKSLFKNCVKPDYQYHQYTIFLSLQVLTVITQRQIHEWQGEDVDKRQFRKYSTMCRGYDLGESQTEVNLSVPWWVFGVISIFLLIIIISSIYYLNNFQVRRIFRDRMPCGYFEKQLRSNSLQLQSLDSFCCLTWLQQ